MIVDTGDGTWTVPTAQGVMIPPATRHRVRMLDATTSSLYIEPVAVPWWPPSCVVVEVSSLLRELLLVAADLPAAYDRGGRDGAIAALLLLELSTLGYASPAAFSYAFSHEFGMSPSAVGRREGITRNR